MSLKNILGCFGLNYKKKKKKNGKGNDSDDESDINHPYDIKDPNKQNLFEKNYNDSLIKEKSKLFF